jgi:peroxiredoxin
VNKALVAVPPIAVFAVLAGLLVYALPDAAERARAGALRGNEAVCDVLQPTQGNPKLGMMPVRAPDFSLKDFSGREIRLSSLRGSVVLVNFWATWCPTCVVEMPSMEKLVTSTKGKNFRLLAVSVDDDWPQVRQFFKKGTPLEIVLDSQRSVPALYGTEKFPETFIVDKDGMIRYFVVSDRDWSQPAVEACLDSLINE